MGYFKDILKYERTYRKFTLLNILFNIFYAIFNILSVLAFIPVLGILFGTDKQIITKPTYEGFTKIGSFLKDSFYFFIIFFRPSLFTAESKLYQQRILGSLLFLYLTNTMVLRVLLPIIWDFWGGFAINQRKMSFLQPTLGLSPKILPYIFLVLSCFVVVFVFSQLPLLMTVFSPESGLNPENFYKRRSFWYFVLILVASFLSPPDFWLQFSIAFFLCSLFECLVLLTFCTALYKDTESFA